MTNLPKHIALIPDGNRRWAKAHHLNPWDGHTEGVKRIWEIADEAFESGISHLTFWLSSYGNLTKRSKLEVAFLLRLLKHEMLSEKIRIKVAETKCRINIVGEWRLFVKDKKTVEAMESLIEETSKFTKRTLTILFAYDGQREMLSAINSFEGEKATEQNLRKRLWTGFLPDVDLVIRTGGEPHWSAGFMMWLTANSQFHFTDTLWPAFKSKQFQAALNDYSKTERRIGK